MQKGPQRGWAACMAGFVLGLVAALCIGVVAGERTTVVPPCIPGVPQEETIRKALEAAADAYRRRDPQSALVWANLATALLESEVEASGTDSRWPTSNAPQLLDALQLYDLFARGGSPELDATYAELIDILVVVERVNASPVKPERFGAVPLDYHLIHHLVTEVGETRVDYHLITWQIDRIGDTRIDYDLITRMPTKIGPIEYRYRAGSNVLESVAGVRVD